MATYTPTTNFALKDTLPTGDPAKIIKGAEHSTEFSAISTAISGNASDISSLQTDVASLETSVSTLETDVTSLETSVATKASDADLTSLETIVNGKISSTDPTTSGTFTHTGDATFSQNVSVGDTLTATEHVLVNTTTNNNNAIVKAYQENNGSSAFEAEVDFYGSGNYMAIKPSSSSYGYALSCWSGTNLSGGVRYNNTSTALATSSDYRLKENVVEISDATSRVLALNPCRFNFIIEPSITVDGFLAHEVQPYVPEAIFGEKDAVDEDGNPEYQGIDQSKLVPLLTKALQEALTEIETLKQRVTTLENK